MLIVADSDDVNDHYYGPWMIIDDDDDDDDDHADNDNDGSLDMYTNMGYICLKCFYMV